jgi:hypothetical protein
MPSASETSSASAVAAALKSSSIPSTFPVTVKPLTQSPTTIKRTVMETFGQARSNIGHQAQQVQHTAQQYRNWLTESLSSAADTLRDNVNRYPPLAAFLFTLLVLSAVPIGLFVLFVLITSSIFLSIALVGFGLVEGFCLMLAGGVLVATLSGIGLVTTIGFSWIGAIYVLVKGGSSIFSRLSQQAQYVTQRTQESLQHMAGSTAAAPGQQPGMMTSTSPQQQPTSPFSSSTR